MRIDSGDDIQQASDDDEDFAVVGDGGLLWLAAPARSAADEVEHAAAQVAGHAEQAENVLRAGVDLALHGKAHDEHGDDGDSDQRAANPLADENAIAPIIFL